MEYTYVLLPSQFIQLLQSNMQTSGSGYAQLRREFWHTPNFQAMLYRTCRDVDQQLGFEKIITALGWYGLRDRLAASYLGYQRDGQFPHVPDLSLVEDILQLEDKLKTKTVDGYNRAFLLGFYKKMLWYRKKRNTRKLEGEVDELLSSQTYKLLELVKTRTSFIDWLALALEGLGKFEDGERVAQIIKAGGGLVALKKGLGRGQQEQLIRDWVAYGASIGHTEAFSNPTV